MSRILLVDDEPNILMALKRELNSRDEFDGVAPGYTLNAFADPQHALLAAETQPFDLVISDYRMPGMDGVSFLAELRLLQPDCIRLVLSGQADMDGLVRAVNEVEIYRFISKPWNGFELRSAVAGALRHQRLITENARLADELRQMKAQVQRQAAELLRLEQETPGITRVVWSEDGGVLPEQEDGPPPRGD